jgi:hypothetical protein
MALCCNATSSINQYTETLISCIRFGQSFKSVVKSVLLSLKPLTTALAHSRVWVAESSLYSWAPYSYFNIEWTLQSSHVHHYNRTSPQGLRVNVLMWCFQHISWLKSLFFLIKYISLVSLKICVKRVLLSWHICWTFFIISFWLKEQHLRSQSCFSLPVA